MSINFKPKLKEEYFYIEGEEVTRCVWRDNKDDRKRYMEGKLYDNRLDATFELGGINEVFDTPVDEDDLGSIGELVEDCIEADFEVVE